VGSETSGKISFKEPRISGGILTGVRKGKNTTFRGVKKAKSTGKKKKGYSVNTSERYLRFREKTGMARKKKAGIQDPLKRRDRGL